MLLATLMKINDVAKKYKTTKRSLRYYEEIGLIKSTRIGAAQSRCFDDISINRLEQILLLRSVQFSIKDISLVLLSDNADTAFEIFLNRLKELNKKIDELTYFKAIISSFIKIGSNIGIDNINIYQLLKDQIYIHHNDERMINMEKSYEGDIIKLEFGLGIVPIISPKENSNFLEQIKAMRNKLENETSKDIPLIRVCDNGELKDLQYRISIKGKTLIDNDLEIVPETDRASEILRYLEFIVKSNIDNIQS